MTVSSSTNVVILSADGSTHSFSFTFKIFAASDLKVIVRSAAGVETEKTLDSHYIIPTSSVGNTSGGNILFKFNTGTSSDAHYSTTDFRPANGEKVILRRQQPQTQELDLVDNDPFSATLIEEQFDKVVMQIQGVQEAVDRSLKFSRSNLLDSSGSQIGSTYPEIEEDTTARANKVLSFDSTGTPIATQEIGTLRGDWAADTAYQERDIVKDTSTSDHFIVNTAHTSSGAQPLTTNANSAKYTAITNFASSIITGTITASAINTTTSGTDNLIAGQDAGDSIQSGGQYNVLLGHDAGTAITTGDYNVAVGNEALKTETNTNMTVAVGHKALAAQINGSSDNNVFNTAVGARAGEAVSTGQVNTLIGGVAGKKLTVGSNNVAIGYGALENEQFTHFNTAVGYQALNTLDFTNSEAAAIGYLANNTALGNGAGYSLDNGNMNTFLGVTAGYHITSGNKNTIVGTYNGNEGGLDIRTSSNYVVLSDGDGNPRLYFTDTGVANFASNVSINGTVTATGFIIGNAAINENDLEAIDDITAGIVSASKAAIVDTNKDITGFRNVTLTGELDAGSLDISGDADIAGTTNLDDTDIDGTLVVDGSNISLDSTSTLNIDNSNTSNGITIGTATSGVPVSIGHSTSEVTINDNLNVTGDLTVNGTTTTVNSTVTTVVDPILTIGSNSSDDNKDRGLEFKYNDGSARVGFFGYDDSASAFTVFTAATNSSEVFSGTTGNAIFNQVTGTLQTAAQTNITSVGTLSSLTVSGLVTADGGIDVDDFHIDGTAISLSAGNLSIDAGDNILLNTKQSSGSGGAVYLKQGGTNYGGLLNSSGELVIQSGSSPTTAVTFSGANATFSGSITATSATYSSTISLTDSDVAHGMTGILPTTTYGQLAPESGTEGGLRITTATEGSTAYSVTATSTTPSTDGNGAVFRFRASKKSGTSEQALADTDDLMTIGNVGVEKITIKGNGDTTFGGNVDLAGYINFSGTASSFASISQPRIFRSGSSSGSYPFDAFGHLVLQSRGDGSNRDIVFATGTSGANKSIVKSDGKVGLGTTSPSQNLHISSSDHTRALITGGTNKYAELQFENDAQKFAMGVQDDDKFFLYNSTGASQVLTVDTSSRVGIGTSSPSFPLSVQADGNAEAILVLGRSSDDIGEIAFRENDNSTKLGELQYRQGYGILRHRVGYLSFETGGATERMRILSGGTILAHKTTSNGALTGFEARSSGQVMATIASSTNEAVMYIAQYGAGGNDNVDQGLVIQVEGTNSVTGSGNILRCAGTNSTHGTQTNAFVVKNSGNVIFGASSTSAPSMSFQPDSGGGSLNKATDSTNSRTAFNFLNPNGTVGSIATSGSATAYNTSSDYRLKENVVTDWDATSRLKQLKPSRFNFKADKDTTVDGFLAHEVSSIVPEAVTGTKDEVDENGDAVMQGIDQSKLVPLLVKTIQELEARIAKLEGG